MKHLTTLTLLFSVFACRGPEAKNSTVSKDTISSTKPVELSPTSVKNKKKTYVIKEDVLDNLLSFPSVGEDIKQVNLPSFELKKIPETNIHNPSIIDTIYQFKNKSGNFNVYKASDKYILYDFLINGNSFTFQNGLKLGVSQSDLLKTLKIEAPKSDTVALGDLEQNSVVNFIFKSDKLVEVNYDGYLD